MGILIGINILKLRKRLKLSQVAFAEKLFLSHATVCMYESCRHLPSLETVHRILEVGEIPKEDLYKFIYEDYE